MLAQQSGTIQIRRSTQEPQPIANAGSTSILNAGHKRFCLFALLANLLWMLPTLQAQTVLRVDANSQASPEDQNGSEWASAFESLQDALDEADTIDDDVEIWVAEGIYKPDEGSSQTDDDRQSSFELRSGVSIYGGFSGTEESREQRCAETHETILSGDLLGDDGADFQNYIDNACNVVTAFCADSEPGCADEQLGCIDAAVVLDGFTIRAGYSKYSPGLCNGRGAGMWVRRASPTIQNCAFVENWADVGAGMAQGNDSCADMVQCRFIDNFARYEGGGLFLGGGGSPDVLSCSFLGNTGGDQAAQQGGTGAGVHIRNQSAPTFANCLFSGNFVSGPASANRKGGGMFVDYNAQVTLINATFSQNSAPVSGGGLGIHSTSTANVYNSIFWGNSDSGGTDESAQIHNGGTLTVEYCCIQGLSAYAGTGNIGDDAVLHNPSFLDADGKDNIAGTEDDNLRLHYKTSAQTPALNVCIDSGDDSAVPLGVTTDIEGRSRFQEGDLAGGDSLVDMGAHEYTYQFTYVTHGNQLDVFDFEQESEEPDPPPWTLDMAAAINFHAPSANARVFSWNARSGNYGSGWAVAAGGHLAAMIYQDIAEHDLQHIHLVGHSRGSGVITEAVRRLGAMDDPAIDDEVTDITIHKTMLDPVDSTDHGIECIPIPPYEFCCSGWNVALEAAQNLRDPEIKVYENETRSESYHRDVCYLDVFPRGTQIDAAANADLGSMTHSEVHTPWYLDTIPGSAVSNPNDCASNFQSPDGYYWSLAAGGWAEYPNDTALDCRKGNPAPAKTPLPPKSQVLWINNGDFQAKAPGGAEVVAVWTGYRWEEPLCPGQWRYVDGVDNVDLQPRPGNDPEEYMAVFDAAGATLTHQPILIPPGAERLRFELRVSVVPAAGEMVSVFFAGEQIGNDILLTDHDSGCFEMICLDISAYAGQMGSLVLEYSGGSGNVSIDNIDISFNECALLEPGTVLLNEIWADDPDEDDVEFIELYAPSETRLEGMSVIVLDGDTGGDPEDDNYGRVVWRWDFVPCAIISGPIDRMLLGSLEGSDILFPAGTLENGSQTYAVVRTIDIEVEGSQLTPLSMAAISDNLIDAVATVDDAEDHVYFGAPVVLHDGLPAGFMHRIPDGADSDSPQDWQTQSGVEFGDPQDVSTPGTTNGVEPPCDLDGDGVINATDLAMLLGSWGPCGGCDADLNGDGIVNAADLAHLLGGWGVCQ